MTQSEIDKIEAELGVDLPQHYKHFLLNYPKELLGLGSPHNGVTWLELKNQADDIIKTNKDISCHLDNGVVNNKLCIGVSGGGDYYFIDLIDKDDTKIYFIDHESSYNDYYNEETNEWNWDKLVRHLSFDDFVKYEIDFWANWKV